MKSKLTSIVILLALLFLGLVNRSYAASPGNGQGLFIVSNCNQITNPVTNYSYCFVGTTISVWNGSTWQVIGPGAGVVSSVTGTANQILASPTTGAVILSFLGPYTPTTYTLNGLLYGNGTSSLQSMAAGNSGTVAGGNTGSAPSMQQKTDKVAFPYATAPTASQLVGPLAMTVAESLPTNCTNSQAIAITSATGSTTFTIFKVHSGSATSIGTIVWSASGTVGAFTCTATALVAGDMLYIVAPVSPDATLAGIGITLALNAGAL